MAGNPAVTHLRHRRVVSLVPSVTETLVTWGAPPVACTRFCEQPDLPHVGGTKNPDIEAIISLAPDVVAMCVEENRREDAEALEQAGIATTALSIDSLADLPAAMRMLARAAGLEHTDLADDLAANIAEARIGFAETGPAPPGRSSAGAHAETAETEQSATGSTESSGLRAFVPIWRRPWMTLSGGTYGSSLLAAVGVVNVFADATERYPEVSLAEVSARRPDVVLAPSEPYPFAERHVPQLEEVAPVILVDGQDLFWWGARTPEALHRLANQLASIRRPR
jgi:ABC-type Fe3+-hydroxamate transport system substrate-binding protein